MIPGINLLGCALQMIASQSVMYFADAGRTKQPNGVFFTTYAAPVEIDVGSVQSVDRSKYQALGLDFTKTYFNWFVPNQLVTTIQRAKSGDVIEWNGMRLQLLNGIDWNAQDEWGMATGVVIGPATGALNNG